MILKKMLLDHHQILVILVLVFMQIFFCEAAEEESEEYEFDDSENSKVIPFGEPVKNKFEGGTNPINVPRGIFHYSMRESGIGSNFKVPDESLASPLEVGGKLRTKDSMIDGFYLPMPMGMNPINFQLIRENEKTHELQTADDGSENLETAYKNVKKLCEFEATIECEEAMKKYYDLKVKLEDEEEALPHEKLFKLSDILSRAAMRNDESNDLGVLFSAPGIQPIGWRTNFAKLNRNNIKVD